jgi:hypothetical protein
MLEISICLLVAFLVVLRVWGLDSLLWALPGDVRQAIKQRREDDLKQLNEFHARLKNVTVGLLRYADEIDKDSKFLSPAPRGWSNSLAGACKRAVTLADQTQMISRYLERRNIRVARHEILRSCQFARDLERDLYNLKLDSQLSTVDVPVVPEKK